MKKIFFGKNLKYLRKLKGINQDDMPNTIGFKRTTWSGYETEKSFPNFLDLIKISEFFGVNEGDLINIDLQILDVSQKRGEIKKGKFLDVNLEPTLDVNTKNQLKSVKLSGNLNSVNAPFKDEYILLQKEMIEDLRTRVKQLQNEIDQMKYTTQEREQTPVAQKKEAKSA